MKDLNYQLMKLCRDNRDGGFLELPRFRGRLRA